MKNAYVKLLMASGALLLTALTVHAEIYKWVDKDGSVKYTDTPPPNGAKTLTTIKKKATNPATTPVVTPSGALNDSAQTQAIGGDGAASEQELAKKKRELEEVEKKNKAEKEAQAKQKQLNCTAAKSNYQSYSQGGRIYKMNEKGERVYLGDQELADGAAKAMQEIKENCN